MIPGAKKFGVFDKIENKFLEGGFFLTKEGKLKKETAIINHRYPTVHNLVVEDIEDENVEIKWF